MPVTTLVDGLEVQVTFPGGLMAGYLTGIRPVPVARPKEWPAGGSARQWGVDNLPLSLHRPATVEAVQRVSDPDVPGFE